MATIGWKLNAEDREVLLERFPPVWPDVIADHVTLFAKAPDYTPLPHATVGQVVGHVDDGKGLQALVVAIDGTTRRGKDGTYHITWSLDRAAGRKAVESNEVLAGGSWTPVEPQAPVRLTPALL